MISFSEQVRQEIVRSIVDRDRQYACLYGILLYNRIFTADKLVLQSESPSVLEILPRLFHTVLHMTVKPEMRGTTGNITITDKAELEKIRSAFHIQFDNREIRLQNLLNNSRGAFVAGVFLGCGSMMNPDKEYHLEFDTPSELLAQDFRKILLGIAEGCRILIRRGMYVIYLKDSEQIEDVLTFMGAQQCTIDLINIKILKDVRNNANRARNCDEANIDKVVSAAIRQINDIETIAIHGKMDDISPELRELAYLRMENPDMSLKELGEQLHTPIGRSGVNHRFRKLAAIAEELRKFDAE